MDVSVIITTYNHPRWLERVIWGFQAQTHQRFELVIADDGSTQETRRLISRLRQESGLVMHHVWHEDRGFRKCEILNDAIISTTYDYLIFVDGDCVPRQDFLETHVRLAQKKHFLSGGIVRLTRETSDQVTRSDIQEGRIFDPAWLRLQGTPGFKKFRLLVRQPLTGFLLDAVTTTRASFNGHNASAWKEDLVRVNGFDERLKYGGLDRELGERLVHAGVRGRQIRHRAACVHLDHSRHYENQSDWERNNAIRAYNRKTRAVRTDFGLVPRAMPMVPWLPPASRFPAKPRTRFDMASVDTGRDAM